MKGDNKFPIAVLSKYKKITKVIIEHRFNQFITSNLLNHVKHLVSVYLLLIALLIRFLCICINFKTIIVLAIRLVVGINLLLFVNTL